MFIKVPIYFEIDGSFRDLGFIQEGLYLWLEQELLGRKASLDIVLPWGNLLPKESGVIKKVKLIKRNRVIDGLK
jgi:hypothetical protein